MKVQFKILCNGQFDEIEYNNWPYYWPNNFFESIFQSSISKSIPKYYEVFLSNKKLQKKSKLRQHESAILYWFQGVKKLKAKIIIKKKRAYKTLSYVW